MVGSECVDVLCEFTMVSVCLRIDMSLFFFFKKIRMNEKRQKDYRAKLMVLHLHAFETFCSCTEIQLRMILWRFLVIPSSDTMLFFGHIHELENRMKGKKWSPCSILLIFNDLVQYNTRGPHTHIYIGIIQEVGEEFSYN